MNPPPADFSLRRSLRAYLPLTLLILAAYLLYLPFSGYQRLVYDAELYWFISIYIQKAGGLSLLNFHDGMRGYVLPLLLLPARVAQYYSGLPPIWFARVLGAATAALGFGLLGPLLWQLASRAATPLRWPRRLLFAGLGFAFWRDHFNFPLSDFPALGALGCGLLLLYYRPGRWAWLLAAGACLAAAVNMRPVYLAAAPFFLALQWRLLPAPFSRIRRAGAVTVLLLGAALVLYPQLRINQRHFHQTTPLVLAQDENIAPGTLYLHKLQRGLVFQKYETTIGADYPQAVLFFPDPDGRRFLREQGIEQFGSLGQYLRVGLRHPLLFGRVYLAHLFNGLDLQYPTPYLRRVYQPTWPLAALNYSVWFGAALVLGQRRRGLRRLGWPAALLLAALLAPCLLVLPTDIECRYLLPLHLLLYAAVCFGWPAGWRPARRQYWLLGAAYLVFLALCFTASASVQASLELGGRSLSGQQLPPPAQP